MDMTQDFVELVGYLDKKFNGIDTRLDGMDAYAKKADTYFQEQVMLGN